MSIEQTPKIMLNAGIMELWHDKRLSDFAGDAEALRLVNAYVEDLKTAREQGIGFALIGSNGTGKTYLAVAALKEALRNGYTCKFCSLGGLVEVFTDGWSSPEKKSEFRQSIRNVDFLLIDDLGKEFRSSSGLVEIVFDNLLRYRVQRKFPTLFTSNNVPAEIRSTYGASVASLLNECTKIIRVTGADFRGGLERWRAIEAFK